VSRRAKLTSRRDATTIRFARQTLTRGILMIVRRTRLVLILACALIAMSASLAYAVSGALDSAFGGDGKVTTNFANGFAGASAVAIQTNGKIVAVGVTKGTRGQFALARYNPNGTLDTSFGGDGRVTTNFTTGKDFALGVAIQANGKIVAAGGARGTGGRFALARYNANGTLDTSFGGDGRVTTNFSPGDDVASGVAIQANGRIVAAGTAYSNCGCNRFALARYNTNGTLDTSFGGTGRVDTSFRFGARVNAVAIHANGKLVVAGSASELAWFALARYNPDGTLDTSFGGDGKVTTRMGRGETAATGVAIQPNGKVIAAGYTDVPHEFGDAFGPGRFALARYRVNGTLDPSFSGDGKVKTRFGSKNASANGVAIQANGKLVAAGTAAGGSGRFALARYSRFGTLDISFGGDGKVTTNFTSGEDVGLGVAIHTGKIVAAGRAGSGVGGRFALSRHLVT
jgi:serralysin